MPRLERFNEVDPADIEVEIRARNGASAPLL
jgi:hypothetical protein